MNEYASNICLNSELPKDHPDFCENAIIAEFTCLHPLYGIIGNKCGQFCLECDKKLSMREWNNVTKKVIQLKNSELIEGGESMSEYVLNICLNSELPKNDPNYCENKFSMELDYYYPPLEYTGYNCSTYCRECDKKLSLGIWENNTKEINFMGESELILSHVMDAGTKVNPDVIHKDLNNKQRTLMDRTVALKWINNLCSIKAFKTETLKSKIKDVIKYLSQVVKI